GLSETLIQKISLHGIEYVEEAIVLK
ncbi:MAG: hypothetical protein K1000chlam3_01255, partial [Chlamydiae bacterium]|nr:hypothetical protein [Chlamydiota bacterium]